MNLCHKYLIDLLLLVIFELVRAVSKQVVGSTVLYSTVLDEGLGLFDINPKTRVVGMQCRSC